jgi:hypothetical protein
VALFLENGGSQYGDKWLCVKRIFRTQGVEMIFIFKDNPDGRIKLK